MGVKRHHHDDKECVMLILFGGRALSADGELLPAWSGGAPEVYHFVYIPRGVGTESLDFIIVGQASCRAAARRQHSQAESGRHQNVTGRLVKQHKYQAQR